MTENNSPGYCIRKCFLRRHCFVLCQPVENEDKLCYLDTISDKDIRSDFKDIIDKILSHAQPIEAEHHMMNGSRKSYYVFFLLKINETLIISTSFITVSDEYSCTF